MLFKTFTIALLASAAAASPLAGHRRRGYSPVRPNYGQGQGQAQNGTIGSPNAGNPSNIPVLPSNAGSAIPDAAVPRPSASGSLVLPDYTRPSTIANPVGGAANDSAPFPTAGPNTNGTLPVDIIVTTTEVIETTTYVYVEGPPSSQVTKTTTLSLTNTRTITRTRTPGAAGGPAQPPATPVPGAAADDVTTTLTATRTNIVTIPRPGGAAADAAPTGNPGYGAGAGSAAPGAPAQGEQVASPGANGGAGGAPGAAQGAPGAQAQCTPVTIVSTTTAVSTVYVTVGATPVGAAGGSGSYTPPKAADTVANPGANSGAKPPTGGTGAAEEYDCSGGAPASPASPTATVKELPAGATPGLPGPAAPSTVANPGAGMVPEEECDGAQPPRPSTTANPVVPEEECDSNETPAQPSTPALPVSRRPSNTVSGSVRPSATGSGSYGGYKRADAAWRKPF